MKTFLLKLGRVAVTGAFLAVAAFAGRWLWFHYRDDPWTRDGRVRADVVEVTPDVPGLVTRVAVRDDQPVRAGQVLFVIDQPRYALALRQAEAALANARAALASARAAVAEARREDQRNRALGDLVAVEAREQGATRLQQAQAVLAQAQAAMALSEVGVDTARLNLARTTVTASVDGVVTDLQLRPGDYLSPGRPALALVDSGSLHVDGYFEETKLPRIHIGDKVSVRIMGEPDALAGHVQSIAAAIEDRERAPSANLLPNVNPTFSWVRLAQRIPVRVALDAAPANVRLIAGRTATVTVLEPAPTKRAAL
jgi:RND family efflux transporter MFP subunit